MEELLQRTVIAVVAYILFAYIVRKLNDMIEKIK